MRILLLAALSVVGCGASELTSGELCERFTAHAPSCRLAQESAAFWCSALDPSRPTGITDDELDDCLAVLSGFGCETLSDPCVGIVASQYVRRETAQDPTVDSCVRVDGEDVDPTQHRDRPSRRRGHGLAATGGWIRPTSSSWI